MDRRDFLKASVMAGSAVAAGAAWPENPVYRSSKSAIVIGGGIGGLASGYEVLRRGVDVTVLEASGRPGGHVYTIRDPLADGLYADAGAEHFTRPGYDIYWEYVRELGLTALPYPRRVDVRYYRDGAYHSRERLTDRAVLEQKGFNAREISFLRDAAEPNLRHLYFGPYLDRFEDEYNAFPSSLGDLDRITVTDLLRKEKASPAAIEDAGGGGSALQALWQAAILKIRGVPLSPTGTWRIQGGNQGMTDALAKRLGSRLWCGCEVTGIRHGKSGVTVLYQQHGEAHSIEAEFLVCCMPLSMLSAISITPQWSQGKQHVIQNTSYTTESRIIMQTRTRFWEEEGISPNLDFGERALTNIWAMAEEVDTPRGILVGDAVGVGDAQTALATFRSLYPGRKENVEYVHVVAWPTDRWAASCNRASFPLGELHRFWPAIIEPEGQIYFAGASFDNLNWGMEAATRSARRVAEEIDRR